MAAQKRCGACGQSKPIGEFARDKSRRDGRMGRCKRCDRQRNRDYYAQPAIRAERLEYSRQRTVSQRSSAVARRCRRCGALASSQRHWYCDACRPAVRTLQRPPGSTKANGYAAEHKRLRRSWAKRVDAGQVFCWRCGEWIPPGSDWHLGHDDDDRSVYRGPEHAKCNLHAAGTKAAATMKAKAAARVR